MQENYFTAKHNFGERQKFVADLREKYQKMQQEELGGGMLPVCEKWLKNVLTVTHFYPFFYSYVSFPAAGGLFHSHVSIRGDRHPADQRRDTRGSQRRH